MFFSWECAISGECILDTHISDSGKADVVIFLTPFGNFTENFYQGLGHFGPIDAFVWLAEINQIPSTHKTRHDDGKFASKDQIKFPIKIVKKKYYKGQKYESLPESTVCKPHYDDIMGES
jgi:hypothetical protein